MLPFSIFNMIVMFDYACKNIINYLGFALFRIAKKY